MQAFLSDSGLDMTKWYMSRLRQLVLQLTVTASFFIFSFRLDSDERQTAVALPGQPGQRVDYCRRDYRNWRFAASGRRFGARNDVDVDGDGCIWHVRRDVAIEVSLLHHAVVKGYRALRHQLRQSERHTRLEHAFDAKRVDRETAVNRNGRAVNPGAIAFD